MAGTRQRAWQLAFVAYALLLAAVSLLPSGRGVLGGWDTAISPNVQNMLHIPAYAILCVLAIATAVGLRRVPPAAAATVGVGCVVFGAALEAAQALITGRCASLADMLFNGIGVGAGLAAVVAFSYGRARRHAPIERTV